jgi:hypothetical protein|tara:strand:- start:7694 stop:10195 length:2502 start_codon:yes stop_codon:yes gene_type:complete
LDILIEKVRKLLLKDFIFYISCLIFCFIVSPKQAYGQSFNKSYPPDQAEKYWFELDNDLRFSEEFSIPGYYQEELNRIEYPSISVDNNNNVYVAYNYTSDQGLDGIHLASFNDSNVLYDEIINDENSVQYLKSNSKIDWNEPIQVSSTRGLEYRPRITINKNDTVWIAWCGKRTKGWNIFVRSFFKGQLGEEMKISDQGNNNFRPVILADKKGRVWVVWERGSEQKNIEIVAKYFDDGRWSKELIVEARAGYSYRPTIVEGENGDIWFAWDFTLGYNTDIYIRQFRNGKFSESIQVTNHPAIDSKASIEWHDKKLWVAWATNRRGIDDWGVIRYTKLRAYNGRDWYELEDQLSIDLKDRSETQSYEFPTLTFDSYGRLYIFNRHDHVFSGVYYEGNSWSSIWFLDGLYWGQRGFYVHTAWASNNQLWLARRGRKTIDFQKMVRIDPSKKKIRLKKYIPISYPKTLKVVEEYGQRGPTKHGSYHVYYGDIHVHTAYSDGSGSIDELYNLYKNIYHLDFLAITEHDALGKKNNRLSPSEWAYIKSLNELYNQPGKFVTINAYEWTHSTWSGKQDTTVEIGHKNVYFKGGEESPLFSHFSDKGKDARSLFNTLHSYNALAFPHHPPWSGITWEDHDPDIETNYEIVSIHGANEYMGNLPIPHRGGKPGTFAQDGLEKGAKIGFVGASDSHGLYYHSHEGWREDPYKGGLTGVLLSDSLNRENIWDALRYRRNYATSGEKYFIDFTINGHPMGSSISIQDPPLISFEAISDKIIYSYVVRNNKELFVSGKIGGPYYRYKGLKDETISRGENIYYLKVLYNDGTIAWSSPIWVNYVPK